MAQVPGIGRSIVLLLFIVPLAGCDRAVDRVLAPAAAATPATESSTAPAQRDLLYGRVTTDDGATYEGRLRWGGNQEALWGHYFNGFKQKNPWAADAGGDRLPRERRSARLFGMELGWNARVNLGRPFMARFGDIARIEPHDRDIRITLKSGSTNDLDRYAADDLADGVRVWDKAGVVDIGEWHIRTIEFRSPDGPGGDTRLLHGTVRTRQNVFDGFIQWDQEHCVSTDDLAGRTTDGEIKLRFDSIRSIARTSGARAEVTMLDGRVVVLPAARKTGQGDGRIYVDDDRYGRVLVSWDAFERVDFTPSAGGPAYTDFPTGKPLTGTVTTRSGRRLMGRLVYDLDESETTETLDAPADGVDYTIPLGLIASIAPSEPATADARGTRRATVTLHSGEELRLESEGDLGDGNAGVLIYADSRQRPEYVSWTDVARIELDRPPEMYPPNGTR
jgi:hypothetical protein